jgi:hypothetical protein
VLSTSGRNMLKGGPVKDATTASLLMIPSVRRQNVLLLSLLQSLILVLDGDDEVRQCSLLGPILIYKENGFTFLVSSLSHWDVGL